jgi:predicted DNA-binding transcriptional regulator AlpA
MTKPSDTITGSGVELAPTVPRDDLAPPDANPCGEIIDMSAAAEMIGTTVGTVQSWRYRGQFPEPFATLKIGPVWERSVVEAWMKGRKR